MKGDTNRYVSHPKAPLMLFSIAVGGCLADGCRTRFCRLFEVTHCKFGNGTAGVVFRASTNNSVFCNASKVGFSNLPNGAAYSQSSALTATGGSAIGSPRQGFLPILLSRDGDDFFFTAMTFYYYAEPGNFSFIYPGGGPLDTPTVVTIQGQGFLGFDGLAERTRCRFGGVDNSADVTTPHYISDSEVRAMSLKTVSFRALRLMPLFAARDCAPRCAVRHFAA